MGEANQGRGAQPTPDQCQATGHTQAARMQPVDPKASSPTPRLTPAMTLLLLPMALQRVSGAEGAGPQEWWVGHSSF